MEPEVHLRTEWRPGDLGALVRLHGELYAREHGFDETFEAYVADGLARHVLGRGPRERVWIAELDEEIVGCIGIVAADEEELAQLRWFLVAPAARGHGLGRRLLDEALAFARGAGYARVMLWTVDLLAGAARLYRAAGFTRVEAEARRLWGRDLVEERYEV